MMDLMFCFQRLVFECETTRMTKMNERMNNICDASCSEKVCSKKVMEIPNFSFYLRKCCLVQSSLISRLWDLSVVVLFCPRLLSMTVLLWKCSVLRGCVDEGYSKGAYPTSIDLVWLDAYCFELVDRGSRSRSWQKCER
mmetsp:Transcript_33488/g.81257  ORF Transcript_33488/g.81257 Transcript_33488/m.81257 type:complete len:139 (-) Transcript_33488:21-437(-)